MSNPFERFGEIRGTPTGPRLPYQERELTSAEQRARRLTKELERHSIDREMRYRIEDEMLDLLTETHINLRLLAATLAYLRDVRGVVDETTFTRERVAPYLNIFFSTRGKTEVPDAHVFALTMAEMLTYATLVNNYRQKLRDF